jgi:hypothetical protein
MLTLNVEILSSSRILSFFSLNEATQLLSPRTSSHGSSYGNGTFSSSLWLTYAQLARAIIKENKAEEKSTK